MAAATLTTFAAALKRVYPQREVFNLSTKENVFLSMVNKVDDFYGESGFLPEVIQYGGTQGRSVNFAQALASKSGNKYARFVLERVKDYWAHDIDGELMKASSKDVGAFFEARKREIDDGLISLGRSAAKALFGDGYGYFGVVSSVSSNDITLATTADASNFEVDMYLVAADNNGTGSVPGDMRASGGTMRVTNVDEISGIITVDSAVSGLAADDYLFQAGDYNGGSTKRKLTGLGGYLPLWTSSALPGTLFSLNRNTHPSRLAGIPYDGTASGKQGSKTEVLMRHQALITRTGGRAPTHVFCNPEDYQDLVMENNGKYIPTTASVKVAFGDKSSVSVDYNGCKVGSVEVFADVNCKKGFYFMLRLDTWRLHTMGQMPHFIEDDGLFAVRASNEDAIEVRARYYGQLGCTAPGWNGQGKWTT